jgi:ABC-2 type transport system ATP-binding protein
MTHDGKVDICVDSGETKIAELVDVATRGGVHVDSIILHKPTLDDVFLHYTGKTIREEESTAKDSMRMHRKAWARGR